MIVFIEYHSQFGEQQLPNQSVNQISIAPISQAKPGSVVQQPTKNTTTH